MRISEQKKLAELFEVILPLYRQELFFHVIALFAAGHHISAAALSAAGNRYDVVHGQLFGRRWASTVKALAFCYPTFPPLGLSEFSGLTAFAFQIRFFQIISKGLDGFSFFHFNSVLRIWCSVFSASIDGHPFIPNSIPNTPLKLPFGDFISPGHFKHSPANGEFPLLKFYKKPRSHPGLCGQKNSLFPASAA